MKSSTKIICVLLAVLVPFFASAQTLPFTAIDYNAASLGKGGTSLVQTSSISGTAFTNAATIPFSDLKADVTAGFAMWAPGGVSTNVLSVTGAYNVKQKLGVAVGLAYGMNPSYDVVDATGTVTGQFKPSEMQLSAGLSYRFLPFLSVGANVGYATSKLAENASYGSLVADVFLMAKFGGFGGGGNMNQMMMQARKMQQDLQRAQQEIAETEVIGTAGGEMVEVVLTGDKKLVSVTIDPQAVDPDDVEMLQDLIIVAVNEGLRQIDEISNAEMSKLTGGLGIPGLGF